MALAAWGLARTLPLMPLPAPPGWVLGATGLALMAWAAWWFRARRTTIEPHGQPQALIVEGPFRINRNPIYTGLALILVALAFVLGDVVALVPALLFIPIISKRFVEREEAALRQAFGEEAEIYFRATRRW